MAKTGNNEFVNTNTNTDETIPTNNSELTSENNTNAPQQTPTDTATFNNSHSHDSEATQNIDPKLASSIDKIEEIKNDIRDSIEKEIPSEEQKKDDLNNKFENLASAMETFRDNLNTEKGKDEFENSKEYLEEAGLIIQDVKDNDGTKDNEIKERILNLLDKTIPQAMDKVLSVDKEATLNSPKDIDAINNDDKVNINNIDISQFEKNSEMFKDAFKDATADNKQEVFNKLCDIYQNSNPDISANDAKIITNAICRIYEEDKLEKINAVRTSIHKEKDGLIGITKGYRYESKKEIGNFEKALDRISGEIDNLGKQLMSDVSLVKCQELKKDFASMRSDIEKGLEKIKAVGSDQNIKGFRRDIYKTLDSIDKKIDEIKENEFVVIGSGIDVYNEEVDTDHDNIEKEGKAEAVYKDPEKTGDAKVDRFNTKLAQYEFAAGIGKWNTKEKNSASTDSGQTNQEDSQKSASTISRNESNPYYTWNTLVRDIYAHSRGILIDGAPVTTGRIMADIGNIVLSEGIPGAIILGIIGGICVLIERLIHGAEKGEADHVDKNEELQDFLNELYDKIEQEYSMSDYIDAITEQNLTDNNNEDNQPNDTSNDEKQKDDVDKNDEDEKQSKDTEKSEEDAKQVDDDKSDVDKKNIDDKADEDKKSPDTTNSDDQENKVDNDEKPEDKKDSKDTDNPEDDKDKIESSKNENKDIESSKEESIKEKSIESKEEKKQEDQKDPTDKVEADSDTDSKVDQDEKDTDPIDNQEAEEKDKQNIEVDETEEKIESDSNDTENKDEGPVEVEESEQESVDQEDSNEQKAIEQDQDDTEIQDENKDVDEPEEEADQVETNEEAPESIETTEIEVQEEPEDSAAEGKIEQDSPEEDTSKEDDAVAAMDDSDDDDQKKKDSGAVEDSSSDSQEGEDTQDESDGDSVDIDGHSEEVDPEDEKVDAKEAATGDDKSEREEQTGIEKDEEEKENVESSENNAEQNDTIDNLSEGMQDASLDATNEESANKIEEAATDNEGSIETATVEATEEIKTDIPEEQSISFTDSVLSNFETNGGDINDIIIDEILDRGGDTIDFVDDIDELINKGLDIDIDYIADTIVDTTTELIEPTITFGFGSDGTIYDVGNFDLGVTPQDIPVEVYDNNINDIDLEDMIISTVSDFATYVENDMEAIMSDTTLPDVNNPELDDKNDTVDNGLEQNQLEKVNASDNVENAADNTSKDFDPSDNNQNNHTDMIDPNQYQNNNDVSEPDVDIVDYDSIFRE